MNPQTQVTPAFQISAVAIRQDQEGRYSLNDLHKAAGSEQKHRPKYWLVLQQTQDLIAEFEKEIGGIPPINSKTKVGTYVVKELVYAYAMWISAKFHLQVIRAYDAQQNWSVGNPDEPRQSGLTLEQIEQLIDRKLKAQQTPPALPPPKKPVIDDTPRYSLHAERPGEFRWIFDISIDQANRQLAHQGLRIVRER